MIAISNTTIDYDRSSRQWQATRNGKVLTYPAGEQGKLGAIADAIKAADEELFAALSKMQTNYPQIGKRVWKMGMLILAGHVRPVLEDDVLAHVKSFSRPDIDHTVIWSGRNLFCDCEDFHGPHCPVIRWRSQRMCIHIGAVQTLRHLGRWPEDD